MRIAVVDDDAGERESLQNAFSRMEQEIGTRFVVSTFSDADAFLSSYDHSFDLICMDIDMPGKDGMTAAQELREVDADVPLVFVTNMAQLAIQGYSVRALDFILKPVNYYSFVMKMRSIVAMIGSRQDRALTFTLPDGFIRLSSNDLYYVEVRGHYLFFHTSQGTIRQRDSLRNWEDNVQGLPFERCNTSYLINLRRVTAVSKDEVQVGGDWLPISRTKKKPFLAALTEYMGGVVA